MAVRYVQGGDAASSFDAGPGVSTSCVGNVPQDRTVAQLVVNADSTVTDQTTGLTWRSCAEGMTLGANRCLIGTLASLNWQQATELSLLPANVTGGWRVPNVKELESLVDGGCTNPAVNGSRFPDQPAVDFWSSTPGWSVSLDDGLVRSAQDQSGAKAVRMVKGGATPAEAFASGYASSGVCTTQAPTDFKLNAWLENADGTLHDSGTGLTWDRCVLGQSWSASMNGCVGTPETLSWSAAHVRANGANFFGLTYWRVPNVKELESIVDRRCSSPALNPDFFRENKETLTWSSTPGWAVNMADGSVLSGQPATFGMSVRLVRGGNSAAFNATTGAVPGVVLGGPSLGVTEVAANIALLLPTAANQRLIFITLGWNANSDAWPREMARILCSRPGATLNSGLLASASQSGVSDFCQTSQWRVVAYNWKGLALDGLDVLPWHALSNASDIGERLGKAITSAATKYEFLHLVGHSAGSNMLHEMGRQLKLADASAPKIQATFLDAFCGYSDRCDYGCWSDWAESYYDSHPLTAAEGTQTRMNLCNAANFDVSRTYPLAEEPDYLAILADRAPSGLIGVSIATVRAWGGILHARHASPYRCYVGSSTAFGVTSTQDFNVSCLGQQVGNEGFGLSYFSYLGLGHGTPSTFVSARSVSHPKESLCTQTAAGAFGGQSAACGVGNSGPVLSTLSAVGSAVSTTAGVVASGLLSPGSTCAAPSFVPPSGLIGTTAGSTVRLMTCTSPTQKRVGLKAAGVEPVTSWSVLDLNVARRTNQIRFTVQFTQPVNAVLTAYIDEAQV